MSRLNRFLTVLGIATGGLLVSGSAARAELIYGLTTDNNIFSFDSATPGTILSGKYITGLAANESLVGIDLRPLTGTIYGVGTTGVIYTLNPGTGAASPVATIAPGTLNGTSFDIDFNPTVDLIRLVSDADQNLAINPATGALSAGQSNINAAYGNPNLAGAAYTNSFAGATSTVLYTVDAGADFLNIQATAASGTQTASQSLKDFLGVNLDVTGLLGFDISGSTGTGYVALQQGGNGYSQFSAINLTNGQLTGVLAGSSVTGLIGGGLFVRDITAATVPEPASLGLAGLAVAGLAARRRRA